MFSGVGGSFASGLNQSLMEWQRIWLEEEKLERADQREGERLAFEEWRVEQENERQRIANELADKRWQAEQLTKYHDNQMDFFRETADPFTQMNIAQVMAEEKNPWASIAMESINTSIVQDPMKAAEIVNEVYNPQNLEYRPLIPAVRQAATMLGMGDGLSGDALQDYVDGVVADAEARGEEGADMHALAVTDRATQSQQMYQNLQNSRLEGEALQSQIDNQEALTQRIYQQMGFDEELHPLNVKQASTAIDMTLAQIADIQQGTAFAAEMQPEVMRSLMYDNDGQLLDNELQAELRNYIVEQARNQAIQSGHDATIAGIIAEHATQNALLDIAIKEGNRDALRQQLEIGVKQLEQMDLTTERMGLENEEYKQLTREARIDTYTRLMSSGDVELATEYADSYLRGIVSEDAYDRIVETMRDRAFLNLSAEEAQLRANTTIAFYEEIHAQEMAELRVREARARTGTAEVDADFRERQHEMDLAVSEANIAVAQSTRALQQAQALGSGGGAGTPNLETVMKAVKSLTGFDMSDVGKAMGDYRIASADIAEERAAINAAIDNPTPQNLEAVYNITGIRPRNAEEARELLAQRETGWATRLESSSQEAQHVISTIFNWADPLGVPLSPQMFGLSEADYPIYYNAIQNNPSYRTVPEGVPEDQRGTAANTFATIDSLSYGQDTADITLGGAQAAYAELKATTPEGLLESLDIHEPADLHNYMVTSSREYDQNLQTATELVSARGYDISNSDDRQRAIADVNSSVQTAGVLVAGLGGAGQLSDSEREELKQSALQWLASNGRQLSFAEEVMYGPHDLIYEINQIKGELSNGATALNWLIPRMAIQDAKGQLAPQ